jgi:hypothetical protein
MTDQVLSLHHELASLVTSLFERMFDPAQLDVRTFIDGRKWQVGLDEVPRKNGEVCTLTFYLEAVESDLGEGWAWGGLEACSWFNGLAATTLYVRRPWSVASHGAEIEWFDWVPQFGGRPDYDRPLTITPQEQIKDLVITEWGWVRDEPCKPPRQPYVFRLGSGS